MTIVAIIQARMGSSRLPGKVLADVAGRAMLERVIGRTAQARRVDRVMVATSTETPDDPIAELCARLEVRCHRGSADDLLDRYREAAGVTNAGGVVRITADCPLIDPAIIDQVIGAYQTAMFDYVSNVDPPSFPDGLDTEVFSVESLEQAWREARLPSDREHVTPYIRAHPELFRIGNVRAERDLSHMRWTVDGPSDLEFVRRVYEELGREHFAVSDVVNLIERRPELAEINSGIPRNQGYRRSLEHDA